MCAVVIFNYTHPDDHIPPTYEITPGFKAFTFLSYLFFVQQYTKLQSLQGNKDSELEELKSSKQELDALQAKVRILFFYPRSNNADFLAFIVHSKYSSVYD